MLAQTTTAQTTTTPPTTAELTDKALSVLGSRTGGPNQAETAQGNAYALAALATAMQDLAAAIRESA